MRILLCDVSDIDIPCSHLGMCYISSYVRSLGHHAMIMSVPNGDTREGILEAVLVNRPDIVGISTMRRTPVLVDFIHNLREIYEGKIVIGGPSVTVDFDAYADLPIDHLAAGDGEVCMQKIIEGTNERMVGPLYVDIDSLPFPDTLFIQHVSSFTQEDLVVKGHRIVYLCGSRGCIHNCSYCLVKGKLRTRSVESIFEEMKYLWNRGYNNFFFVDNVFLEGNPERAERLASLVSAENMNVGIIAYLGVKEIINHCFMKPLLRAGLRGACIGIESMSESQLQRYNKGISVDMNRKAMECVLGYEGFSTTVSYIMIDPLATVSEYMTNWKSVLSSRKKGFETLLYRLDIHRKSLYLKKYGDLFTHNNDEYVKYLCNSSFLNVVSQFHSKFNF